MKLPRLFRARMAAKLAKVPGLTEKPVMHRVVCGWCSAVLVEGDVGALTSHGICGDCSQKMVANARVIDSGADPVRRIDA